MKLIETYCRSCKDPVDVEIADEDWHDDTAGFIAKIGVICKTCRELPRAFRTNGMMPEPELRSTHNDP